MRKASSILFILALLCTSCRTRTVTREVPVVLNHTTENNTVSIVRDTLLMRDSVYHYVNGDTVRIERWNTIYNHEVLHDTITAEVVREVPVQVTTTEQVEVPRKLSWWQKTLMWLGALALVYLAYRVGRARLGKIIDKL